MRIRVRLFAIMSQRAGVRDFESELPEGASLEEAVAAVRARFPGMPWPSGTVVAVNQEYVSQADGGGGGRRLDEGDELAIIPPVSGG